ncbi:MAG: RNA 3'-terminal phosphate cyclase [Acidilobus sp.]
MELVHVDGSIGEGGGQVLRMALAVSAITGRPVRVFNIRIKRSRPGLQHQHLTSVKALAALTRAKVEGATLGSTELTFYPGSARGGDFTFDIGTAGSVTLLLQAIMPIMALSREPMTVSVIGGTDVPKAPPIDYFRFVLRPLLSKLGFEYNINLVRRGHYPRGGGKVIVATGGNAKLRPIDLVSSGGLVRVNGLSHCVRLPSHVAVRQARAAEEALRDLNVPVKIELEYYEANKDPHLGPGSGIVLWATTERSVLGGDSLGERGKPAEWVGREAARSLLDDLSTGMALDRHASDMLLVYAALSGGVSRLGGSALTSHAKTVIDLLNTILPEASVKILQGFEGRPFIVEVRGSGLS